MEKNKQGRASRNLFAIFLLGFVGLTVFFLVMKGRAAFVAGWNCLNGIFSNLLFEFNVTAMSLLIIRGVISIIGVITALITFVNARSRKSFIKILTAFLCIEKLVYCTLFLMKMNMYWDSSIVSSNLIIWLVLIFITMLELMISILMVALSYEKKVFAPVTIIFSTVLALFMISQIINTHVYNFCEIPVLPETAVWSDIGLLNEGTANMACYTSLCFALMGILLSISVVRIEAEKEELAEMTEKNAETADDQVLTEEEPVEIKTEIIELLPEIDTDVNIKAATDLETELKEILGEEETEEVVEDVLEEVPKIAAQTAATELINITMRLQKGEINEAEYNQLKKDLFDKL